MGMERSRCAAIAHAGEVGAGRAKPNPQAIALLLLVRSWPDTLQRLDKVAGV
jgi:hypothetical protein